jgi:2-polyprenyl-3-methyl-5-hydroxy-6-metoxy-1,4-benzoquinol methylase
MSETKDLKTHWEAVYGRGPADNLSWYQENPATSLRLIKDTGVGIEAPVIDIGGGASVLADRLIDAGYADVTVLDISEKSLRIARQRLGAAAGRVDWRVGDVTKFRSDKRFMIWHDRAVFHFLTEAADRRKYVAVLKSALSPGGQAVIGTFAIGGPEKCSGLDIVQYDAKKLLVELGDGFELRDEKRETHLTPTEKTQAFCWFRLARV